MTQPPFEPLKDQERQRNKEHIAELRERHGLLRRHKGDARNPSDPVAESSEQQPEEER